MPVSLLSTRFALAAQSYCYQWLVELRVASVTLRVAHHTYHEPCHVEFAQYLPSAVRIAQELDAASTYASNFFALAKANADFGSHYQKQACVFRP